MAKKLLIVDDDIIVLEMLTDVLENYGYSVTMINDGEKAIELVTKKFFDIILLDFEMPNVDGVTVLKTVKKFSPLTTVIMMTAYAPDKMIEEASKEGVFAILPKPIDIKKLGNLIDKGTKITKILIVISDLEEKSKLSSLLYQHGYKIATADTTVALFQILQDVSLDIIVLDTSIIQEKDLVEVLSGIKTINSDAEVILLIDSLKDEYTEIASQHENVALLLKPVNLEILKLIEEIEKKKYLKIQPTILIVEDDESVRLTLKAILAQEKYKVIEASNNKEAIEKIRKEFFDVAIIDQKLPDGKGTILAAKIKEIHPTVNIIILTGYAQLDVAIEAIKVQVFDFLQKPAEPDTLLEVVKNAIYKKSIKPYKE